MCASLSDKKFVKNNYLQCHGAGISILLLFVVLLYFIDADNHSSLIFLVNILSLGVGASISWTSPYLPILQTELSPLGEAITTSQASWIGSLLAVGALLGSFFYGWLSEKLGRHGSLIAAAVPQIVSFI